ncbi:hypothetical protein CK203_002573 [Vitis vinifera]|uniref:Integrase catalytic domain-containing protein n=1 Tax=Vitis vinifera TaxID=29760 RepID=A0A438KI67_VITVI|nr:hypothetical protein CK203_002573 [Vitis vinifera]
MSELIAMCVQEKERLKVEKPDMAHLTIGPNKKSFKKALDVFKIYKVGIENQLNRRIKSVRFDRGGEYYGRFTESGQHLSAFALFLREHGIIANYTMSGTPEQNDVAE